MVGSRPLYGYHWQDKHMMWEGEMILVPKAVYIIYEPEARVVQLIFMWCKQHVAVRKIAQRLTDMGIPAPKGGDIWRPTTVHNILTQEAYTGKHHAFKRKFWYEDGHMHHVLRDKDEWIEIADGCIPQLIDPDTFEQCQKILDYNKQHAARNNPNIQDTLLRGYCFCGYCGSRMSVQRNYTQHTIDYRCYKENQSFKGKKECKGAHVRSYILDKIGWQKIVEIILNPDLVEQELKKQRIEDPTKGSLKASEELLSQTVTAIINLTTALQTTTDPIAQGILTARIAELGKLKLGYEDHYDQILRYRINWEDAMRALDTFKRWCDEHRERLTDPSYEPTWEEKREALEMIGLRIEVFRDGHDPRYVVEVAPPDIMSKIGNAGRIVSTCASAF
jgi:hypothetical protein